MGRRGKIEKLSVKLPNDLIEEIRSIVSHAEFNSFFTEALEHYLAYRKQKVALERAFGAWTDENHPNLMTPQDSVAYVRDIRETIIHADLHQHYE
jgi:metal-responsive CopG/Arc/MetJ family transcriptional regulator